MVKNIKLRVLGCLIFIILFTLTGSISLAFHKPLSAMLAFLVSFAWGIRIITLIKAHMKKKKQAHDNA
jgi:hypothetical protein